MKLSRTTLCTLPVSLLLACPAFAADDAQRAVAVIHSASGSEVKGKVTFDSHGKGVQVAAELEGLKPGRHGFHIHEYGDCSAPDAESAGGHFNPSKAGHGAPTDKERHHGDLGNITADENGKALLQASDSMLKLSGDDSIIGRAVVVHANPDDLKSQPSGNAGPRIGCGVVGIAKK